MSIKKGYQPKSMTILNYPNYSGMWWEREFENLSISMGKMFCSEILDSFAYAGHLSTNPLSQKSLASSRPEQWNFRIFKLDEFVPIKQKHKFYLALQIRFIHPCIL